MKNYNTILTEHLSKYIASKTILGERVELTEFIFAQLPLEQLNALSKYSTLPDDHFIVHRQAVSKTGLINEDSVAYSVTMGTDVGDFTFNFIGLLTKEGLLAVAVRAAETQKLATKNGLQGNSLTRSILLEFSGAAEATQINVPAQTWQIDFTARLNGIDEDIRNLARDIYGEIRFFNDGFLAVKQSKNIVTIKSGVAYLKGYRVELAHDEIIGINRSDCAIYIDLVSQGDVVSKTVKKISFLTDRKDDYTDKAGNKHYIIKIADVENWNIIDRRIRGELILKTDLGASDGYRYIGKCKSIAELRLIEPKSHGQSILLSSYYLNGNTGGGEFVADFQDSITEDDGGVTIVTAKGKRWKRVLKNNKVNVLDFGAKANQDSTVAFEGAFKYAGKNEKIITSDASTYLINKPLFLSGVGGIELPCLIYGTFATTQGAIITWFENSQEITRAHKNYINFIMWQDQSQDSVAIRLIGLKSTSLKIGETGCVQLYATTDKAEQQRKFNGLDTSSLAYNRFDIDVLSTLHITGKADGWVNENTINTQRFRAVKTGLRAGILIDGDYAHNHNLIRRGCLEGEQIIHIDHGSSNTIEDVRFERNPQNRNEVLNIRFSEKTWSNRITASWVSSPGFTNGPYGIYYKLVNVVDNGLDNVVSHNQENYSDEACLFELSQTTPFVSSINKLKTGILNNNTDIHNVRNIKHLINGDFKILKDYAVIYEQENFIHVTKGTMFDLSSDKKLFRISVRLFDKDKTLITDQLDELILSGELKNDQSVPTQLTMRGNDDHINFMIKSDKVAYVKILISSGNNSENKTFNYLRFIVRYPKHFIEKSRGFHNIVKPERKNSLMYYSNDDIDMGEIGEGIPCYKHDLSEMKINITRSAITVKNIDQKEIDIDGTLIQFAPEGSCFLIYEDQSKQEKKLAIETANNKKITLKENAPVDLTVGQNVVFLVTKTKSL
ncbi:TPA: phage tail protein [Pasteurella multocida]|nr:phage tail protein [Pasteurella multocida]HEH9835094.1 phage tail protein [Pasteurella multocida]